MGRRPKLYLPLTVTFFEDDRIIAAGDAATLLYVAMCLRCKSMGTDGRLRDTQIARLNRPKWRQELAVLAREQLVIWDEVTEEWCVRAWFAHNDSTAEIDDRRRADRERKRADSGRNPDGIQADSAPKGKEGKGKEEKEGNPRGALHAFADDGSGSCSTCHLPVGSQYHLSVVEESA